VVRSGLLAAGAPAALGRLRRPPGLAVPGLLCPLWQPQARALEWADLWQRADQQGAQLLEQGQAREAAKRFNDRQWQGMAHYAAGDYAAAAERFAQFDTASAHYNRGNALAKSGELAAALDAYDSAWRNSLN